MFLLEDDSSDDEATIEGATLEEDLVMLQLDFGLSNVCLKSIADIMNKHTSANLPKDARTIMRRAKKVEVFQIEREDFVYVGVRKQLENLGLLDLENVDSISLTLSSDGLPIANSSNQVVWPILMSTDKTPELVCVVGIYYGRGKPTSEVLLDKLAEELDTILREKQNGKRIEIRCFTADLPAMALLKGIKLIFSRYIFHNNNKIIPI